ncbi:MAG: hypothetical protein JRI57_09055 [Deltaproteobacteria bacterium]|nr:hypothetical protein [Deltaproteobacteria bacterium]MBW1953033.1 hypothetical protein [Deltaproteobacteria bacterium]MBW1985975.1 hypothetical protein [Deltaproteobacteria bacterium]MBW2135478.1 hypothetical protein [Deltaproteobacteria bacterium]
MEVLIQQNRTEVFFQCPHCGEESVLPVIPGWNKLDCPYCAYYLIVYQDEAARLWSRTPGVLQSPH